MSRLLTAAAYAMHNMPIGTTFDATVLSDEDAYDVVAKPIDTPYGPIPTISPWSSTRSARAARSAPRCGS
jgi:cytochrome c